MSELPAWLVLAAVPGHIAWLLWVDNRVHATGIDYRRIKFVGAFTKGWLFGGSLWAAGWWLLRGTAGGDLATLPTAVQAYVVVCTTISLVGALPWLVRRLMAREADVLLSDEVRLVDLRSTLGTPPQLARSTRWWTALPGNEVLTVAVHEKRLRIPRLPVELEGLRIVHLSDVHITGNIGKPFYQRIMELADEAEPDLVLLSGDLLENEACWDWIPDTFGRLRARHGTYFVLGNHDVRIDGEETRRRLSATGLVDLRGPGIVQLEIRGARVTLAGNELPWIAPAADPARLPPRDGRPELRVLVSHSPDQYAWARRHDFDLMLAGHVHGGQIQIPPIGPILAPSRFGVRYACGVFHEPPTVMHVSRGTSSKKPVRFNCPPELTTLILTGPAD